MLLREIADQSVVQKYSFKKSCHAGSIAMGLVDILRVEDAKMIAAEDTFEMLMLHERFQDSKPLDRIGSAFQTVPALFLQIEICSTT